MFLSEYFIDGEALRVRRGLLNCTSAVGKGEENFWLSGPLQGLHQVAQTLADRSHRPLQAYAFGEEACGVADGLSHVEAHPRSE